MDQEAQKKVDESWKNQVRKEKEETENKNDTYHQPNFSIFLSSLGMQAMIAMGKLENPLTKKLEINLEQARFLIDTIGVIKEKTKGNLSPEEETLLNDSLYSLRMIYVESKGDK
ncbi:MAG: DUF1844 domain-containing protein [Candidatus Omnitrophica bacterium]|nr:DUF1844 domain-containing protein [Candidatus Omnitrophota bacterium]